MYVNMRNKNKVGLVIVCVISVAVVTVYIKYKGDVSFDVLGLTTKEFIYEDDRVYDAAVKIRARNCLDRYKNGSLCEKFVACESGSKRSTGCRKRFPNVILIGAYKSGTREVLDFLAMNPWIRIKRYHGYEVAFFDKNFHEGKAWYRNQMPVTVEGQVTLEKSPGYMTSIKAPQRILHTLGKGVKLLVVLRDPVARTFAHFSFDKQAANLNHGGSIERCVFQNKWNNSKHVIDYNKISKNCFAIKHSLYVEWIEHYLKYFNLPSIHFINWIDLVQHPCDTIKTVETFLSVDNVIKCEDFIHNQDKRFYCLADIERNYRGICYGTNRGRFHTTSHSDLIVTDALRKFFKPYNERLYQVINKTFEWYTF